jgi:hypothetical protein
MYVLFVSTAISCIVNEVMILFMGFVKPAVTFNGNTCLRKQSIVTLFVIFILRVNEQIKKKLFCMIIRPSPKHLPYEFKQVTIYSILF